VEHCCEKKFGSVSQSAGLAGAAKLWCIAASLGWWTDGFLGCSQQVGIRFFFFFFFFFSASRSHLEGEFWVLAREQVPPTPASVSLAVIRTVRSPLPDSVLYLALASTRRCPF